MPCRALYRVYDAADLETEECVQFAHPLSVTLGQVVIDRDHVHAVSVESVQVSRKRRYQCLTFTCLHLGDASLMKHDSADELHSEMLHAQRSPCGFPAYGECLGKYVVERLALSKPALELIRLGSQFFIGELLHLPVVRLNYVYDLFDLLYLLGIEVAEDLFH